MIISQQTQNICIPFVQRRLNVFDVGSTLYKCYTNGLCLLWCLWGCPTRVNHWICLLQCITMNVIGLLRSFMCLYLHHITPRSYCPKWDYYTTNHTFCIPRLCPPQTVTAKVVSRGSPGLYVHKGGLRPDSFHFISFVTLRWHFQGQTSNETFQSAI